MPWMEYISKGRAIWYQGGMVDGFFLKTKNHLTDTNKFEFEFENKLDSADE